MKKNLPKIRAPKGFTFRIRKRDYQETTVSLFTTDHKVEIGYINLIMVRERPKFFETHSRLNEEYWGQGLGALLYARAIQHALEQGWRIRSSGSSSNQAQNVWRGKTLRKYFSIRFKPGDDPYSRDDKWYAYAK
jgi:GNAT superfamily N-acetyltransferase